MGPWVTGKWFHWEKSLTDSNIYWRGEQHLLTHRSAGPRKSDIFFTSSIQSNMGWTRRANAKNNGNKLSVWSVNDKQSDIKLKNLKIKLMFLKMDDGCREIKTRVIIVVSQKRSKQWHPSLLGGDVMSVAFACNQTKIFIQWRSYYENEEMIIAVNAIYAIA